MSQTVTIRISDDQMAALGDAARAASLPPSTLAARFIVAGLDGDAGPPADGALVQAVQDELAEAPAVQLEAFTMLARAAERGAPRATVELIGALRKRFADSRAEYEQLVAQWRREMTVPVYLACEGCRKRMPGGDVYRDWPTPANYQPDNPLAVDQQQIHRESGSETFNS